MRSHWLGDSACPLEPRRLAERWPVRWRSVWSGAPPRWLLMQSPEVRSQFPRERGMWSNQSRSHRMSWSAHLYSGLRAHTKASSAREEGGRRRRRAISLQIEALSEQLVHEKNGLFSIQTKLMHFFWSHLASPEVDLMGKVFPEWRWDP